MVQEGLAVAYRWGGCSISQPHVGSGQGSMQEGNAVTALRNTGLFLMLPSCPCPLQAVQQGLCTAGGRRPHRWQGHLVRQL
jgi:hypothetical protein